ncbi:hypothetical protein GMLC_09920 [Geomonas limicola]|uniref:Solute-binding protein family 3/N-terminal domain-containing protein n=1 Tax=Geomonas limicola TaxID=2740186 RepID=A0A6V8N792_9BACT|nr:transporter substrate-binding domain-containing protein [Geomonas limicola]GFO67413.1 hypothetical protein GMLC_09920 [Geomonas limicola]
MRYLFLILALAVPLVPLQVHAVQPTDIVYMTEDYPPENYLENGRLKGYAVDILRAVWKEMGYSEQPIQVLPWARGYLMVQERPNHMLFAMAKTPERLGLFKWVGPIYYAKINLFSLSEKRLKVESLEEARHFRVGVLRKDICETMLKEAGFTERTVFKVNTLEQLLRMLKADHIDMMCTTETSIKSKIARDGSLVGKYTPVAFVGETNVYYAFNKGTDDEIVAEFQGALTAINTERKRIIRRYHLQE